jgi:disulfide bond formation protein DsbB
MLRAAPDPMRSPAYRLGALLLFAALGVILIALAFEYIGGYEPCPLCLQQRYAYYVGIPALFAALVLVVAERPKLAAVIFLGIAVGFLANAALGTYHAGAEWKLWAGPETCAAGRAPLNTSTGALLKTLEKTRVVRCDEAAWRFLGLSFAGWNVIASLALAGGAISAARKARRGG